MATSTNLKISKVDVGALSKEVTINAAIDNFDQAITGYLLKSVAGAANVTLLPAEQSNAVIEFSGALTGNITVYIDVRTGKAYRRQWLFVNSTTGAFTITLKLSNDGGVTGFGTGATSPAQTKRAYFNHSNQGGGANGDIFRATADQ